MMFQAKSVGIDIQPDFVRVAVATSQGGRTRILSLLEKEVPEPAEGEASYPAAVIRDLLREAGANGDVCVTCLPAASSINRLLSIPLKDSAKIKQTLKFQLEPQIPYPIEQVISDFVSIRTLADGSEILAVAVAKETIAERMRLLKSADVDPQILTLDALALADFYITPFDFSDDRVTALLLAGPQSSFLGFFVGERLIGYRTLGGVAAGDEGTVNGIIKELRRSLVGLQSSLGEGAEIGSLCVGGQGGDVLRDYLAVQFRDFPVRSVEFNERTLVDVPPEFSGSTDSFGLAIALAHAGLESTANPVNFMQEEFSPRSIISRLKQNIKFSLIVLAVMSVAWFISVRAQIYGQSNELEALNEAMVSIFADTMPGVKSPSAVEQRIRQEREKFKSLKNYSLEYVSPLEVLDAVAGAVPAGVELSVTDLAITENVMRMTGTVDSYGDIDAFKKQVENSPLLSNVTIDSMNVSKKTNKVNFRIRADIAREAATGAPSHGGGDS